MNKNILIWIVCAIVVVAVGYFGYKAMMKAPTTASTDTQSQTASANGAATSTQVQAQEVAVGTGAEAKPGMQVSVLYVGQLPDGTVFDSSAMHNNQAFTFVLGATEAGAPIPGFQIGVNGMKEGGERIMQIPPSLAYGDQEVKDASGKVIIPANTALLFDVKLVKVGPAPATSTAPTL